MRRQIIDFYNQNGTSNNEIGKEDVSDIESDVLIQNTRVGIGQRAKFMSNNNSKSNDLSSNKPRPQPKLTQNTKPVYRPLIGDTSSTDKNCRILGPKQHQHDNCDRIVGGNIMPSSKISSTFISPVDEVDSRNDIFVKSATGSSFVDSKPMNSLNVQVPKSKPHSTVATKNKNLHNKINRGISPNQPPANKMKAREGIEDKKASRPSSSQKSTPKEVVDLGKRSSSLKVK